MKKIIHVLGGVGRGGAETMVMNMLRNIDREKYRFDFLISTEVKGAYYDEIISLGSEIHTILPDYSLVPVKRILKRFYMLYNFFRTNKEYDVLHIHTNNVSCIIELLAAKLAGVKIRIAHSHNTKSRNIKTHLRWRFLIPLVANYRFACGEEAGKWLYGKRFRKLKNSKVIPNAIDVEKFSYNEKYREEIRKEFNIEDKIVIGNIGRIEEVKNQKFLVDIIENMDSAVVLIVGTGTLKEELKDYAEKKGAADKVIFAGVRSDVHKFYSAFDCFAMPSFHEGFPVTLVEAQCGGVPIIASDKISEECNLTGEIVFLPIDRSTQEWIKRIDEKIELSSAEKRGEALELIKKSPYNISTMVKQIEKIYNS